MYLSTSIISVVIYTVQAIIIIVGNTFTIFVFWTQRSRLKRTYFLLINLAIADFLVGITELTVLGTAISQITTDDYAVLKQSQSYPFVAFVLLSSSTSVYFLALISLERAFAVLWPIRHRIANSGVYIKSILVVWTIGLCFFALTLLSFHCSEVKKKYVFVCTNTCLLISLLVICASYLKIHNRLRAPSPKLDIHTNQLRERNVRLSKTLFIAIASSLVFWMPAFVVYSTRELCLRCIPDTVVPYVYALHLANSMMNPLVYSFRMQIFKDILKKFCSRKRHNMEMRATPQNTVDLAWRVSFTPKTHEAVSPTILSTSGNDEKNTLNAHTHSSKLIV